MQQEGTTQNQQSLKADEKAKKSGVAFSVMLVERVIETIKRYVFLQDESLYLLITLWVIQTHLYSAFQSVGYIYAHSSEPGSGKTRLLDVLDVIVRNSSGIEVGITEAVLFRKAKDHTILIDEIDSENVETRNSFRKFLNAGYRKGGIVERCRLNPKTKGYDVETLEVFGPKAMAGIGTSLFHRTTKDRTFMIAMARQKRDERRASFRLTRMSLEALLYRGALACWAYKGRDSVQRTYEAESFPYLESFGDRTREICEPLAAILEVAFKNSPRLPEMRRLFVAAIGKTRAEQATPTKDHEILKELARLSSETNTVKWHGGRA